MNRGTAPLLAALLACCRLPASGQIKQQAGGYLFRLRLKAGQTLFYNIHSTASSKAFTRSLLITGPLSLQVTAVKNSVGTVLETVGPLRSQVQTVPAQRIQFKEDALGHAVQGREGGQNMVIPYPAGPKKPGQSWEGDTLVQGLGPSTHAHAVYRFAGLRKVEGQLMAELYVTFTVRGASAATGKGAILLLMADGSIWKTSVNLTLNGGQGPIYVSSVVQRIHS